MGVMGLIGVLGGMLLFLPVASAQFTSTGSGGEGGFVSTGGGGSSQEEETCAVPPTWKGEIKGKERWVPTYIDKKGKPHAFCDRQTGIVIQRTPGTPLQGELESPCFAPSCV